MKNKGNKILNIVIVVIIIAIIFCLAFLFVGKNCNNSNYEKYKNNETDSTTASTESNNTTVDYPENPIDFQELHKTNDEIFAWIQIPDTNVDYPILQSRVDDNFYLHKNIKGEYDFAGSIYTQSCNTINLTDRVTVAYGHNMRNGSMFADLHKFKDKDFFDKHSKFYVYTKDRKLTYQVVSAYVYDDRHIMNSFNFAEDDVFQEYIDYIQNPRSVTKNVREKLHHKLSLNDRIITLSTCLNSGDGRFLLQGVLIKDEHTR